MRRFRTGLWLISALAALLLPVCACAAKQPADVASSVEVPVYADGIYRGVYNDGGIEQFSVEFVLKENRFVSVTLHSVNYRDGNYLSEEATRIQTQVASQYEEAAAYLVGKPVSAAADLMDAAHVTTDRDAVTSATLRTGKLVSALRDGLRRGAFLPDAPESLALPESLPDGVYRGGYFEDARELAAVECTLRSGLLDSVQISVSDGTSDAIRAPHCELMIAGKPVSALSSLYGASDPELDAVGASGSMLVSAFMDAFSRGVFEPVDTTVFPTLGGYASGVYRGFYYEGGTERISIQFELVNDVFGAVQFRTLTNDEGNCLAEEAPARQRTVAAQFRKLAEYLSGKEVSSLYDLFRPENIVSDGEDSPADALPSNQMISALMDGLSRGVYRPLEMD